LCPQSALSKELPIRRLLRKIDFARTFKGLRVRRELFVLYACANDLRVHRFGTSTPRAMGPAVVRNRYKRWSRQLFKKMVLPTDLPGTDWHALIGNKSVKAEIFKKAEFKDFEKQWNEAFEKLIHISKQSVRHAR
jgi:ribonuclease P protein component